MVHLPLFLCKTILDIPLTLATLAVAAVYAQFPANILAVPWHSTASLRGWADRGVG